MSAYNAYTMNVKHISLPGDPVNGHTTRNAGFKGTGLGILSLGQGHEESLTKGSTQHRDDAPCSGLLSTPWYIRLALPLWRVLRFRLCTGPGVSVQAKVNIDLKSPPAKMLIPEAVAVDIYGHW